MLTCAQMRDIVIRTMKPNEIRAELIKRGIKVTDIAEQCGVKQPNVSAVISGGRSTLHIRKAISRAIKTTISEIWPEPAEVERK